MLCVVGVNGTEWMKVKETNENWREDLKKKRLCRIVMINIVNKMDVVRNGALPLKLGCLDYSLSG